VGGAAPRFRGHRSDAHDVRRDRYARRRPEETALYELVEEHWPEFRDRAEEAGGLPKFIIDEFEEYLRCGRLYALAVVMRAGARDRYQAAA
jgi:hypothetical protein